MNKQQYPEPTVGALIFNKEDFVMLQEFVFGGEFHEKKHFIFLDHICKTDNNEVILNKEGSDYIWVNINEVLNLPVEPYTRNLILEYKNKFNK